MEASVEFEASDGMPPSNLRLREQWKNTFVVKKEPEEVPDAPTSQYMLPEDCERAPASPRHLEGEMNNTFPVKQELSGVSAVSTCQGLYYENAHCPSSSHEHLDKMCAELKKEPEQFATLQPVDAGLCSAAFESVPTVHLEGHWEDGPLRMIEVSDKVLPNPLGANSHSVDSNGASSSQPDLEGCWNNSCVKKEGSCEEACKKGGKSLDTSEIESDNSRSATFLTVPGPSLHSDAPNNHWETAASSQTRKSEQLSTVDSHDSMQSSQQNCEPNPGLSLSPHMVSRDGDLPNGTLLPPLPVVDSVWTLASGPPSTNSDTPFERKVIALLTEMKEHNQVILQRLTRVEESLCQLSNQKVGADAFYLPTLPLQTIENLEQLEAKLTDDNYRMHFIRYISRIGGESAKLAVTEAMRRLVGNELSKCYSMHGTEKKRTFSNTILCRCIKEGVLKGVKESKEGEIDGRIARYLVGANDRGGGREKRRKKCQDDRNLTR